MKTINKFTLQYAEKTSQHLFARKIEDKVVEYMKVDVVEIEGEKTLLIITLDEKFKLKSIAADNGRFVNYIENYRDGLLKHEADVYLRSQIFGYSRGEYFAVPNFKIEDGLGRKISIRYYIDEIMRFFIKENFFQKESERVIEEKKNNKWGFSRGLLHLHGQPEDVYHFRLGFIKSDNNDNPINIINQRYHKI
jgi:hypothetical protein